MANILIGGVNLKTLGMHGGVANAKDYGALANDTYDNYGITQALVDAWEALDGGTILFPASREGTRYRFTQGVVNDSTNVVSFCGSGPLHSVVLWLDSDTDDAFLIKYGYTGSYAAGLILDRIHFMGNNDTDGLGVNQSGVLFAGRCGNHLISSCGFQYFSGYAVAHDATVSATYNQNSSIRNTHFWNVGGCFGPTADYADGGNYLFSTHYTLDNVGLDNGILWTSSGHTAKPYIWDLRATRDTQLLGNMVIEGAGAAGQTACIALATGNSFSFNNIHYEITTNGPTYLFAFYGVAGGKFNSSGEKIVKISRCGGLPMWFQDTATNETTVHIEDWNGYNADTIAEIAVWENGIEVNKSGCVEIERLNTKGIIETGNKYVGRIKASALYMDMQQRYKIPWLGAPRKLFSWNPSQGSPFRDWGEGVFQDDTTASTWTVEPDGDFLCLRLTGKDSHATKFPRCVWSFGQYFGDYGQAEDYQGATITLVVMYRTTIDPADSPKTGQFYPLDPSAWENSVRINAFDANGTEYSTAILTALIGPNAGTEVYSWQIRPSSGNLTVVGEMRIRCFEAWLGIPDKFDLEPASVINSTSGIPAFAASDATPSVGGSHIWKTDTGSLTITDLDNFQAGDEVTIISKGAVTYDTTGTNLVGSSVDIVTASGDITRWVSEDGTTKRLLAFVDVSADNSAGA